MCCFKRVDARFSKASPAKSGHNSHAKLCTFVRKLTRKAAEAASALERRSRRWRRYCRRIWLRLAVATWHSLGASLRLVAANARSAGSEDAALDSNAKTNAAWTK
jgi:hypothetical protein